MDELDNNKLKAEDDEREVESEENQRGEEIEVNEDRLPSRAMAIHEHIRQEGERDGARCAGPAMVSDCGRPVDGGLPAGEGNFSRQTGGDPGRFCWKTSATPSALLS